MVQQGGQTQQSYTMLHYLLHPFDQGLKDQERFGPRAWRLPTNMEY